MARFCLMLAWLATAALSWADGDLEQRLQNITSLQGSFQQQVFAADGKELERSEGRFTLLQPGYFSWHILAPDEQVLVAANQELLHYDVELETATRRPLDDAQLQSPLAILSGDAALLQQLYSVEQLGADSFRLVPRSEEAGFIELNLNFAGALPSAMSVRDRLQQRTVIQFTGVVLNPPLAPADFNFIVPAGVDVYTNER